MPFNPDYPGLDAVLVWKQGGVWKALLIQVTLSPRHAASAGGEVVFACWVEWLTASGVPAANIGVLYCVKPEDHPYSWQPVGGLAVAQYSMSWTTGRHKRKRSSKRTTTEAQCSREGSMGRHCFRHHYRELILTRAFAVPYRPKSVP